MPLIKILEEKKKDARVETLCDKPNGNGGGGGVLAPQHIDLALPMRQLKERHWNHVLVDDLQI